MQRVGEGWAPERSHGGYVWPVDRTEMRLDPEAAAPFLERSHIPAEITNSLSVRLLIVASGNEVELCPYTQRVGSKLVP